MTDARRDRTVAAALLSFEMLGDLPGGWCDRDDHALALVSGLSVAGMNGVWTPGSTPDPALVATRLDGVAAEGLPYSLQFRDDATLAAFATDRGLVRDDDKPLMRCDALTPAADAPGVEIAPTTPVRHADIAALGFEAPREAFDGLIAPELSDRPESTYYVATLDGDPVGTGQGVVVGGAVAVFTVATVPSARGRGVGAAVTRRIVADGLAAGAAFAWLQPSPLAEPLYARLGFERVDTWQVWVSP